MYYCCGMTEKGIMSHNEDAMLIAKDVVRFGTVERRIKAPFIAAVSDGVSGENAGEVASLMCLEKLAGAGDYTAEGLREYIMDIHRQLADFSRDDHKSSNMQTTLCGIAVSADGTVISFNVGDSRLYRFRDCELSQLSRDQSLVQLLYEEGKITIGQKKNHVHKNIIFPVIGNINDKPTVDVSQIDGGLLYGDILIICTDGLSDYISDNDMLEILELPKNLSVRVGMLVKKALRNGGRDNISVIAVVYQE